MNAQPISIREINQLRVLNLIRDRPGISRSEILRRTNLGKATISTIVSTFIEAGVVKEAGAGVRQGSAGRRPVKLELDRQVRMAIGVELTGSECIAILTDLHAHPLHVVRHTMADSSINTAIEHIVRVVDQLLVGHDRTGLLGIGVGVPGHVDASQQRVIQAVNVGWFDVPLGCILTDRIGVPVTVVKRQNAGAMGEYRQGVGLKKANLLFISVSVGIGCGIIIQGNLYEGMTGQSGEIGHTVLLPNGNRCTCGNYGCLETLASCPAIAVRAREKARMRPESLLVDWADGVLQSITCQMVVRAALQGDRLAVEIVQEAGRYLGLAIAKVVNLLDPAAVIIGGELLELGDLYLDAVRESVQQQIVRVSPTPIEITPSSLKDNAAAIGAALLVIDHFFTQPNPFFKELSG